MDRKRSKLTEAYIEIQKRMFFSSYEEGKSYISDIQNKLMSMNNWHIIKHPQIRSMLFLLEKTLLEIAIYHKQSNVVILKHFRNLLRLSSFYDVESIYLTMFIIVDEFNRRGNQELANKLLHKGSRKIKNTLKFCKYIISERKL